MSNDKRRQNAIRQARKLFGTAEAALEEIASVAPDLAMQIEQGPIGPGYESAGFESTTARRPAETLEAVEQQQRTTIVSAGLDAVKKIEAGTEEDITPQQQNGLEALILLTGRPALLVQNGDFFPPPKAWTVLTEHRGKIKDVIAHVGRVEVSGNPNYDWLGTAFLVSDDVVMTNRHVALEFSRQEGATWTFRTPMGSAIDFHAEIGGDDPLQFTVKEIVGVHETYDLALLRVERTSGATPLPPPLSIAGAPPVDPNAGRKVYVIGYPAWDGRRNDPEPMLKVFANIFNVKRLQPGEISGEALGQFEFFHDCSTLGGNSGSPVIDLETHNVLGLHFGGKYLEKNHAVPLWTLQQDDLVKKAKLNYQ